MTFITMPRMTNSHTKEDHDELCMLLQVTLVVAHLVQQPRNSTHLVPVIVHLVAMNIAFYAGANPALANTCNLDALLQPQRRRRKIYIWPDRRRDHIKIPLEKSAHSKPQDSL